MTIWTRLAFFAGGGTCAATGFETITAAITAVGAGLVFVQAKYLRLAPRHLGVLGAGAAAAVGMVFYVQWHSFLSDYRDDFGTTWLDVYPREAPAWLFVRGYADPQGIVAGPDGAQPQDVVGPKAFAAVDAPFFTPDGKTLVFSAVGEGPAAGAFPGEF